MNKISILIFVVFVTTVAFAEQVSNPFGFDWRTDKPIGKNWIKITDIHYLDKSSVKKVTGTMYQASLCNEMKSPNGGIVWNYFNVRVDCKIRQAYSQINGEWVGPANPTEEDNAVLQYACK
ncbi:MAG: hypothetical protein WA081_04255 [Desulfosalsimonadaceae bacterium]